jgi:RNA polymerase sigma-70 factor (ECF subfamily)
MAQVGLTLDEAAVPSSDEGAVDGKRLRALVEAHYDFVWRSLRRLGVPEGDVDDAAQKVFLTASRKLASIRRGAERSFLFQTAYRVASDSRRTLRRRREVPEVEDRETLDEGPSGEELLDLRRARQQLDEILDSMPLDLRAVFVLFELDEMTTAAIAELLELPAGTVASRLRRARLEFRRQARSVADSTTKRGTP